VASGTLQNIPITPVKEGILVKGLPVFVFLADNLSSSLSMDFYATRRISTIIAAAFSRYSQNIEQGFELVEDELIPKTGYLIKPSILAWHKRTENSDGDPTHIMVRVDFIDAQSGDQLDSLIINRGIKFQMEGLNHPCELFIEPFEDSLQKLYR
jgi:hypothetical protein